MKAWGIPWKTCGLIFFGILSFVYGQIATKEKKKKEGAKENLYFIYYLNKQFYAASILFSVL